MKSFFPPGRDTRRMLKNGSAYFGTLSDSAAIAGPQTAP